MNSAATIKNDQRLNEKQACVFNGYIRVFMFYLKIMIMKKLVLLFFVFVVFHIALLYVDVVIVEMSCPQLCSNIIVFMNHSYFSKL